MKVIDVNIKDIVIKDRTRKDFGEIGALAASIAQHGLLQPIVLSDTFELQAGGRRLKAFEVLGRDTIPAVMYSSLTPIEKKEIELEENIRRKNLTWQEEVTLKAEIHRLKTEQDPTWTIEKSAAFIGDDKAVRTFRRDLFLAKSLVTYPSLKDEKDITTANNKADRLVENSLRELMLKTESIISNPSIANPVNSYSIYKQDCLIGIKDIQDGTIDLIITDFPYGVDIDNLSAATNFVNTFTDTKDNLLSSLLPTLSAEFKRALKDGCHAYIFFPTILYHEFYTELSKHLTVNPVPLIWYKPNSGGNTFPDRKYTPDYETIFFCYKGKSPNSLSSKGNCVLTHPLARNSKLHPTEKPLSLIQYLMKQSSIEGETVLDTFAGSGVMAEAAILLNRKHISFEVNDTYYNICLERITNTVKSKGE